MKYSKSAIGLLTREYRSVLKKCLLINLGLFALGAVSTANVANAYTDEQIDEKIAAIQGDDNGNVNIGQEITLGAGSLSNVVIGSNTFTEDPVSGSGQTGAYASVVIGDSAHVAAVDSAVAIGDTAYAEEYYSMAIGAGSHTMGDSSMAIGSSAWTGHGATSAVALGDNANAQSAYSVALGAGSVANGAVVSVGSGVAPDPDDDYQYPQYRRIVNVANGEGDHDAVTVSQLNTVNSNVETNTSDITALKTTVGDSTSGLVKAVATNTSNISANTSAINILNGTGVGSVANSINQALNGYATEDYVNDTSNQTLLAVDEELENYALKTEVHGTGTSATNLGGVVKIGDVATKTAIGQAENQFLSVDSTNKTTTIGNADYAMVLDSANKKVVFGKYNDSNTNVTISGDSLTASGSLTATALTATASIGVGEFSAGALTRGVALASAGRITVKDGTNTAKYNANGIDVNNKFTVTENGYMSAADGKFVIGKPSGSDAVRMTMRGDANIEGNVQAEGLTFDNANIATGIAKVDSETTEIQLASQGYVDNGLDTKFAKANIKTETNNLASTDETVYSAKATDALINGITTEAGAAWTKAETWMNTALGIDSAHNDADKALQAALAAAATEDETTNNIAATSFAGALHELDVEKLANTSKTDGATFELENAEGFFTATGTSNDYRNELIVNSDEKGIVLTATDRSTLGTTSTLEVTADGVFYRNGATPDDTRNKVATFGDIDDSILKADTSKYMYNEVKKDENAGKAVSAGALTQLTTEVGKNMKADQLGWNINVAPTEDDSFASSLSSEFYEGLTGADRTVIGALNKAGDEITQVRADATAAWNKAQGWASQEFGYDTNTTDANTVLRAAGFTGDEGKKIGFLQAVTQNRALFEDGEEGKLTVVDSIQNRILKASASDNIYKDVMTSTTYDNQAVSAGALKQIAYQVGTNMKADQLGWNINVAPTEDDSFASSLSSEFYEGLTGADRTVIGALNKAGDEIAKRTVTKETVDSGNVEGVEVATISDGTDDGTAQVFTVAGANTVFAAKQAWLDGFTGISSNKNQQTAFNEAFAGTYNILEDKDGVASTNMTLAQALRNIDSNMGKIHGLAASLGENYKGNLAAGSSTSDHLTSLDSSIGDRRNLTSSNATINTETAKSVAEGLAATSNIVGTMDFSDANIIKGKNNITDALTAIDEYVTVDPALWNNINSLTNTGDRRTGETAQTVGQAIQYLGLGVDDINDNKYLTVDGEGKATIFDTKDSADNKATFYTADGANAKFRAKDVALDKADFAAGVQASLDKADSALQAGDNVSKLANDAGYVNRDVDNLSNYTKTSDLADVALSGDFADLTVDDGAIKTRMIAKNAVTKEKLGTGVQASLEKADTAVQEEDLADVAFTGDFADLTVADGAIKKAKLGEGVQKSLAKADSALQVEDIKTTIRAAEEADNGVIVSERAIANALKNKLESADLTNALEPYAKTADVIGTSAYVAYGTDLDTTKNQVYTAASIKGALDKAGTSLQGIKDGSEGYITVDTDSNKLVIGKVALSNLANDVTATEISEEGTGFTTSAQVYDALEDKADVEDLDDYMLLSEYTTGADKKLDGSKLATKSVTEGALEQAVQDKLAKAASAVQNGDASLILGTGADAEELTAAKIAQISTNAGLLAGMGDGKTVVSYVAENAVKGTYSSDAEYAAGTIGKALQGKADANSVISNSKIVQTIAATADAKEDNVASEKAIAKALDSKVNTADVLNSVTAEPADGKIYDAKTVNSELAKKANDADLAAVAKSGKFADLEVEDEAIKTKMIKNGAVTYSKLGSGVQASLDLADSSLQGIANNSEDYITVNGNNKLKVGKIKVSNIDDAAFGDIESNGTKLVKSGTIYTYFQDYAKLGGAANFSSLTLGTAAAGQTLTEAKAISNGAKVAAKEALTDADYQTLATNATVRTTVDDAISSAISGILADDNTWTGENTFEKETTFKGGIDVTAGNVEVDNGDINVGNGDINVTEGNIVVAKGTVQTGSLTLSGNEVTQVNTGVKSDGSADVVTGNGSGSVLATTATVMASAENAKFTAPTGDAAVASLGTAGTIHDAVVNVGKVVDTNTKGIADLNTLVGTLGTITADYAKTIDATTGDKSDPADIATAINNVATAAAKADGTLNFTEAYTTSEGTATGTQATNLTDAINNVAKNAEAAIAGAVSDVKAEIHGDTGDHKTVKLGDLAQTVIVGKSYENSAEETVITDGIGIDTKEHTVDLVALDDDENGAAISLDGNGQSIELVAATDDEKQQTGMEIDNLNQKITLSSDDVTANKGASIELDNKNGKIELNVTDAGEDIASGLTIDNDNQNILLASTDQDEKVTTGVEISNKSGTRTVTIGTKDETDNTFYTVEVDGEAGKTTIGDGTDEVVIGKGDITADKSVTVGDNAVVIDDNGNITAQGTLAVQGDAWLNNAHVVNDLGVGRDASVGRDLAVAGVSNLHDTSVDGNFAVTGQSYLKTTSVDGALTVSGDAKVNALVIGEEFATSIDNGTTAVEGEGSSHALATTATVMASAENAKFSSEDMTGVTQGTETLHDAIEALDSAMGTMALNTQNKNLVDDSGATLTNATDALNALDGVVGNVKDLNVSKGNLHASNKDVASHLSALDARLGTIKAIDGGANGNLARDDSDVATHFNSLDVAMGNRTNYKNNSGSNGYVAVNDGTKDLTTMISEVASNIGKADDISSTNQISARQTVNANLSSLDAAIGNVDALSEELGATDLTSAINNLNTKVNESNGAFSKAINKLDMDQRKLRHDFEAGMAGQAALSALVPNAKASGNTQLAVGTGAYKGHTAAAVGGFHWFTDNLLFNAGVAWDNNEATGRMGITYSW